jgi:hypothetical protein
MKYHFIPFAIFASSLDKAAASPTTDFLRKTNHDDGTERNLQETCSEGWVNCNNGKVVGNEAQTCFAACNDGQLCCGAGGSLGTYTNACSGFTGKVCKDGSCMSDQAGNPVCNGSTIPEVSGPSCVGLEACTYATITTEVSGASCVGTFVCSEMTAVSAVTGGSCVGLRACLRCSAGTISGESCVGKQACNQLGQQGSVGNVSGASCVGQDACYQAGAGGGSIGNIHGSCSGTNACKFAAILGGTIDSMNTCCNGDGICQNVQQDTLPEDCAPSGVDLIESVLADYFDEDTEVAANLFGKGVANPSEQFVNQALSLIQADDIYGTIIKLTNAMEVLKCDDDGAGDLCNDLADTIIVLEESMII